MALLKMKFLLLQMFDNYLFKVLVKAYDLPISIKIVIANCWVHLCANTQLN